MWAAAGCSTLIVLTAAGTGVWIYQLVQGVKSGATSCLPSSFPRYPAAKFASWSYDLNGPFGSCQAVFESTDNVETVALYYQREMNGGAWEVSFNDTNTDTVIFESANGSAPFGTVQVAPKGTGAEITVQMYSAACLLPGFPAYPRAKFGGQSVGASGYGCHVVFLSNDRVPAVIAYYKAELSRGSWQVTASDASQVSFRLMNGKRTAASGTVTVGTSVDERTQITIDSYP